MMKRRYIAHSSLRLGGLVLLLSVLSACQVPDVSLPKLSLTRETPAPVEVGSGRIQRVPIPANRLLPVLAGDTIYSLATRYQITPQSLIADNDLSPPYALQQGQNLKVTPSREHIVRPTDSLFTISQRYAVSQYHIVELNQLPTSGELVIGARLLIPDTHDFTVLDGGKGANTALAKPAIAPTTTVAKVAAATRPAPKASPQPRKNFVAPAFGASDGFTWPLEGEIIQDFGPAGKGIHNDGVNISAERGSAVSTAAPGTVAYIGENLKSFGTLVLVKHDGGYITAYAHLDSVSVAEGDVVSSGQVLGQVGQTGRVTSPQLHFEVRLSRQPINPHDIIKS